MANKKEISQVASFGYVTLKQFEQLSGYSVRSSETCIQRGIWQCGVHYHRSPIGRIFLDLDALEKWIISPTGSKAA